MIFSDYISKHYNSGVTPLHSCYPNLIDDDYVYVKLFLLLYAEDTIILSENEAQLQLSLNAVHTYCTQWKLTVNTDKTKIIFFSRGKVRKFPVFSFGENNISVVSDYVYLGVTFNYNNNSQKLLKNN